MYRKCSLEKMNKKINNIIVAGGGSAGWIAAGFLASKGFDVTVIESPNVGVIGVGESTVPAIGWLAREMGMVDSEWMPLANATYKLGIRHEDWSQGGSHWFNWFVYDRTRQIDQHRYLFGKLPPLENFEYGYHVDAHLFGETICKVSAIKNNCKHVVAHIEHVIADPEFGVKELITKDGRRFSADFYIDATGFKKLLANQVGIKYRRYDTHLNNRAIAAPQPSLPHLNRYTTTKSRNIGWIWEIPLAHRRGTGYVYASDFLTDDEAVDEYLREYPGTDVNSLSFLKFDPEVCTQFIKTNVAVAGLSGGFIEPLEATSLFLTYLMVRQTYQYLVGEYSAEVLNRSLVRVFDQTAHYVLSHYTLSGKRHNEYWKYFYNIEQKLKTFNHNKEIACRPDAKKWGGDRLFFPYHHWAMLDGYGLIND